MKEAPAILKFLSWLVSSGTLAKLSNDEWRLLGQLLSHADSYTGEAWPSRPTILKESGLKRREYLEARAWLKGRGILSWHRAEKPQKRTGLRPYPGGNLVYVINFEPSDRTSRDALDKRSGGNLEKPHILARSTASAPDLLTGLLGATRSEPSDRTSRGDPANELLKRTPQREDREVLVGDHQDSRYIPPSTLSSGAHPPTTPQEQTSPREIKSVVQPLAQVLVTSPEPRSKRTVPILSTTDAGEKVFEELQKKDK